MNQGRTNRQVQANNKIMVTFLVAMLAFILFAFSLRFFDNKASFLVNIEKKLFSK
ncbi:hypothetical protein [Pedobacter sp. Leaf170]|uniref:hypothetical protein n=1 Tax=Pedobacter sp. Leaf170 TaxID=2876558 RepID=UPI001E326070|nr:hypothetical protein [Pedobacter sp. Leaf170]